MALSEEDLKAIKDIVSDSQVELAAIVNSAFEKHEQRADERFTRIENTLEDHTNRFDRMERKQDAQQWLSDNHDRRISRLEKEQGLKPLSRTA